MLKVWLISPVDDASGSIVPSPIAFSSFLRNMFLLSLAIQIFPCFFRLREHCLVLDEAARLVHMLVELCPLHPGYSEPADCSRPEDHYILHANCRRSGVQPRCQSCLARALECSEKYCLWLNFHWDKVRWQGAHQVDGFHHCHHHGREEIYRPGDYHLGNASGWDNRTLMRQIP